MLVECAGRRGTLDVFWRVDASRRRRRRRRHIDDVGRLFGGLGWLDAESRELFGELLEYELEGAYDDAVLAQRVLVDELEIERLLGGVGRRRRRVVERKAARLGELTQRLGFARVLRQRLVVGVERALLLDVLHEQLVGLVVHLDVELLVGQLVAVEQAYAAQSRVRRVVVAEAERLQLAVCALHSLPVEHIAAPLHTS